MNATSSLLMPLLYVGGQIVVAVPAEALLHDYLGDRARPQGAEVWRGPLHVVPAAEGRRNVENRA
jgi:hypothetical protein